MTKPDTRMSPEKCYALFLRRGVGLHSTERKMVREEEEWTIRNPELAAQLDALVKARAKLWLRRMFKAIDGTIYPKGMPLEVIARWYGSLITYCPGNKVVLSVEPHWVEHAEAKAEEEVKVPSPHQARRAR